jgi:hypothetical protein
MPRILDNIKRVHAGFPQPSKQAKLLKALKDSAIQVAVHGVASDAGRTYMSMFADSEDQLKLLTNPEDVAGMPWLHEVQAYLVANAMCAPVTNGQTGNAIFNTANADGLNTIDAQLSADVQESVVNWRPEGFRELFP